MIRFLVSCVVLLSGTAALAQPPVKLTLTPAKPPTPALRYQLLPDARITTSGDAALIYRQIVPLMEKKGISLRLHKFASGDDMGPRPPLDQLPKDELRTALADYDDIFELLDKATRCDHCDWGLLGRLREKGIATLLPEFQPMRQCAVLLTLRARLELAEGHFDKAAVTLRTGYALARHTGDAEVLICFLVGTAIANMMSGEVEEFISQPGAPNLYYALADLPAPLISLRKGLEGERIGVYGSFPGLAAVAADLNAGNLSEKQLADGMKMLDIAANNNTLSFRERIDLARTIQKQHEIAKQALIDAGRPRDKVEAMPYLQVALLHALLEYDAALDNLIVWHSLPYWELRQRLGDDKPERLLREERLKDPKAPAIPLVVLMLPGTLKVTFNQARLERKLAMLRTIEALRFYAATHDGKFPPTLAAVKETLIPLDPMTGLSFAYERDGDTATLRASPPAKTVPTNNNTVVYELQLRK